MNQIIPDNNLPAYLQRYDVVILNDKEESVGKVLYTTVGAIPSNKKKKRVWQLNLTGYLKPNVDTYNIVYDFSEVDYKYKEQISFEKITTGTFNICGKVLDASKIIGFDYSYSDKESTLTIKLDSSKWDFRLKKEVLFSYQLNVDDATADIATTSLEIICNATYDVYFFVDETTSGTATNYYGIYYNSTYYKSFSRASTSYTLDCDKGKISIKYNSTLFFLPTGTSTTLDNGNVVLYTQTQACPSTGTNRKIGTIEFTSCPNTYNCITTTKAPKNLEDRGGFVTVKENEVENIEIWMYGSENANNSLNPAYFYFYFQDISSTGFTLGGYMNSGGTCQCATTSVKEGDSPTLLDQTGNWAGKIKIKKYKYDSTKKQATIEFVIPNNFASKEGC